MVSLCSKNRKILPSCTIHNETISSIDTLDLFSAILSAVGGGGIGAIVADSHLGSSLSKIIRIMSCVCIYSISFYFCHNKLTRQILYVVIYFFCRDHPSF
jgi:hypothetical protein